MLHFTLEHVFAPSLNRLSPNLLAHAIMKDPLKYAAILDFIYNLGAGSYQASTLRRVINAGEWDRVPAQLKRWVNAGGRRMRGLEIRRDAEIALWNKVR